MPMNVFVTDGDQRPALAIVRSLGRRGASVQVGEAQPESLASASRYCSQHITYPSPYVSRDGLQQFLIEHVCRARVDVLLPVTDVTTHAVALNSEFFRRHCAIAVPPFEAFALASNKASLVAHARRCGVSVPRTEIVNNAADASAAAAKLAYPVVVKSAQSRLRTERGWTTTGVHFARSPQEVRALFEMHADLAMHPALLQERVVGPGIGVFTLFDRGRLVAEFAHRRLREQRPAGGASVLCESIALDPDLRRQAVTLLGSLGWHGVAMLEYKQDAQTGRYHLLEVNGRFWGSLQLAIDAGVDFPFLVQQLATGRPVAAPPYRVGVRSRWLLGDIDHLLLRLLRSNTTLDLPPGAPSRWRVLADFLAFTGPGLRYDVFGADDPGPFWRELRGGVAGLSAAAIRFATRAARKPVAQRLRCSAA